MLRVLGLRARRAAAAARLARGAAVVIGSASPIALVRQRADARARRRAPAHAARRAARRPRPDRDEGVLPRRRVRRVHGARRRAQRRLVPRARGRGGRAGRSRPSRGWPVDGRLGAAPGGVPRHARGPVRLLHPGPARCRREALLALVPAPVARRGRGGPRRQPVPLRGLRADHRGRAARRGGGDGAGCDATAARAAAADRRRRRRRRGRAARRPSASRRRASAAATGSPAGRRTSPTSASTTSSTSSSSRSTPRAPGSAASTPRRALALPGVRLVLTAADLPPPDAALRAPAARPPGARHRRDEVPRRPGRGRRRRDARPRRGGAPRWSASSTRRCPPSSPIAAALDPARRSSRTRRSARTTRSPAPTSCASTASAGATSRRPSARPTSSSRARTRSRWSPSSRSSRTRSWRRPTATGSRSGARSSTRTGSSGSWRRCSACRCRRSASSRPTRAAGSAASSTRSTSRCSRSWPARAGRPVRLVLSLEETFQAVRRAASRDPRPHRLPRRRHARVPGHRRGLPDRRVRGHRRPRRRQGHATRRPGRTRCRRSGSSPGASCRTPCPSTAFRGFGNPQQIWAVESNMDEAALPAGHRPARAPAAQPRPPRRPVHPGRHRGATASGPRRVEAAARAIGWGTPVPAGRGRGIAVGLKSGPTTGLSYSTVRLLADGSVVVYAGHVRHGPGRAHDLRPDRRPRARRAARLGHGRHGRHGRRALRPADLGEPVDGAHGQRGADRLPRGPGEAADDGRPARGRRRGRGRGRRGRGPRSATGRCRSATCSCAASAGSAARSSASARCARRRSRSTRSAARPRSTSSTARRSRSSVDEETGDVTIDRHVTVSRRRQGAQPGPGPRPGRGRRDHGPRPHADGALPVRRRGPDPEPGRDRLPDPDLDGPAAVDGER